MFLTSISFLLYYVLDSELLFEKYIAANNETRKTMNAQKIKDASLIKSTIFKLDKLKDFKKSEMCKMLNFLQAMPEFSAFVEVLHSDIMQRIGVEFAYSILKKLCEKYNVLCITLIATDEAIVEHRAELWCNRNSH